MVRECLLCYKKIRKKKGYAKKMLELALMEFKKMNFKEVFCNYSAGNISSAKVIEKMVGFS